MPRSTPFFADVFRNYDLSALQQVLDAMERYENLEHIKDDGVGLGVPDTTGALPNKTGLAE